MPIYEYRCAKCGEFEIMQRITEPPLSACPTCRRKVTKLISASGFHLKGSGWYLTDYARKQDRSHAPAKADDKSSAADDKPSASSDAPAGGSDTSSATESKGSKAAKKSAGKKGEKAAAA